jgi:nucleotide-binding universal stress UspA family protein
MNQFTHIVVPIDFGEAAMRALDIAVELSKTYGASLSLLHAYEIPLPLVPYPGVPPLPSAYTEAFHEAAQRRLDGALAELRKQVPAAKATLACGAPWEKILEVAKKEQASLIVMGTHGRRGLKHALLGSVAEKVVRLSPVPVLTVRAES